MSTSQSPNRRRLNILLDLCRMLRALPFDAVFFALFLFRKRRSFDFNSIARGSSPSANQRYMLLNERIKTCFSTFSRPAFRFISRLTVDALQDSRYLPYWHPFFGKFLYLFPLCFGKMMVGHMGLSFVQIVVGTPILPRIEPLCSFCCPYYSNSPPPPANKGRFFAARLTTRMT